VANRRAFRGQLVYRGIHCTVHFEADKDGIRKLAMSGQIGDASRDWIVNKGLPYAKRISPRSGKSNMPPSELVIGKPFPMMRVAHRLVNTAEHAAAVEWGDKRSRSRQKPHRVFGKVMARFNRPYVDPH
jgi:hypothetical protein